MDCSLPGSSVHGILQARIQDSLPFSPPGDLPNPGIKPVSPRYPALTGGFFAVEPLRKPIETNGKYQFLVGTIENHYNSQCFLLCAIYSRSHEILVTKALQAVVFSCTFQIHGYSSAPNSAPREEDLYTLLQKWPLTLDFFLVGFCQRMLLLRNFMKETEGFQCVYYASSFHIMLLQPGLNILINFNSSIWPTLSRQFFSTL